MASACNLVDQADPRLAPLAFGHLSLDERIEALVAAVPGRKVLTTSFGLEDQLLTHIIATRKLEVELVTIDTGRLFPETYDLWADTEARYGRTIRAIHPRAGALEQLGQEIGANGFRYSVEARLSCCGVRKVEPLARAIEGTALWLTGLRGDQSAARAVVDFVSWDDDRQLVKAAPLFDWKRPAVAAACRERGVPTNPLHEEHFLSIGCQPCTRAVRRGEDERAGRWWWEREGARECGLHVGDDGRLVRAAK